MIKKGWVFLATQGKKTCHYAWLDNNIKQYTKKVFFLNPFAPGDFAEKRVLKLVKWFSGHCRAITS